MAVLHRTVAGAGACLALTALLAGGCDDSSGNDQPEPRLDTTLLDFGDVDAGSAVERSFTLTNAGGGILEGTFGGTVCDPPTVPADNACWTLVGDGAYRLTGGQSKTFVVRFAPYTVSVNGGECGIGDAHCQLESAHGIVHCHATGVGQ